MIELSIDLGSKTFRVAQRGAGLLLCEPCVAIVQKVKNKNEIVDAGFSAVSIISKSMGGINIVEPVKEGIIVNEDIFIKLVKFFLRKIYNRKVMMPTIKAIISITSAMSNSERRVVEKCFFKAGIKEIIVVESPISLLAETETIGGLFVDIGGGKTEVCAVTNRGIVNGYTVNIAGDAFNQAIIDKANMQYGVKIGNTTIETLKKTALSLYLNDDGSYPITGGGTSGEIKTLTMTAKFMREAVIPRINDIIEVVMLVISETAPELASEISRKGIFLTGNSVKIPGLIEYFQKALELKISLLSDIDNATVLGGTKFFNNKKLLSQMLGVKII